MHCQMCGKYCKINENDVSQFHYPSGCQVVGDGATYCAFMSCNSVYNVVISAFGSLSVFSAYIEFMNY